MIVGLLYPYILFRQERKTESTDSFFNYIVRKLRVLKKQRTTNLH